MPVEVTAGAMADMVGRPSEDMPPPVISKAGTLVSRHAVEVVIIGRGPRADTRAMQDAHTIGMVPVTGGAITRIRPMDILGSAITAPAIHTTGVATTATATAGTIRTTEIGDTTLTSTDTGRP
jgi:hypothetical protein